MEQRKAYHCTKCNIKIAKEKARCSQCHRKFSPSELLLEDEIDLRIKNKENGVETEEEKTDTNLVAEGQVPPTGSLQCRKCKRIFLPDTVSSCNYCNMPLKTYHAEKSDADSAPKVEAEAKEKMVEADATWVLVLTRYDNLGKPHQVKLEVNKASIPIGRYACADEYFKDEKPDTVEDQLSRVSGYNAFVEKNGDKLFILYDNLEEHGGLSKSKANIRINGVILGRTDKKELSSGDKISFGKGDYDGNMGSLFITVEGGTKKAGEEKTAENQNVSKENKPARNMGMGGGMASIGKQLVQTPKKKVSTDVYNAAHEIAENIISEKLAEFEKKQNAKIDEVGSRVEGVAKEVGSVKEKLNTLDKEIAEERRNGNLTDEQYLDMFFKGFEESREILNYLSEEQKDKLISAAVFEHKNKREEDEAIKQGKEHSISGYKGSILFLGLLAEIFSKDIIYPDMMRTYARAYYDGLDKDKELMFKEIHSAFTYWDDARGSRYKSAEVESICKKYAEKTGTTKSIRDLKAIVGKSFAKMNYLRQIRNKGPHETPVYIPEQEYIQDKKKVLDVSFYKVLREVKTVIIDNKESIASL